MAGKKGQEGCEICGKDLLLFKCKYCGKAFCEQHKMPEKHECTGLDDYRRQQAMGVIAKPGGNAAAPARSEEPAAKRPRMAKVYRRSVLAIKLLSVAAVIVAGLVALVFLIGYVIVNTPTWSYSIPVSNDTGVTVVLTNYRNATDPTWDRLMAFLKADNTIDIPYSYPAYTCADFARTLHDRAEASGIKCSFVAVEFYNRTIDYSLYDAGDGNFQPPARSLDTGHGLDVFRTVDRGTVYVDASSDSNYVGSDAKVRIAYLEEGQELNEIDLDWAANNTSYSFYEDYKRTQLDFIADERSFYKDLNAFNALNAGGNATNAELKLQSEQLSSRAVDLNLRKSRLGPFYFPIGVVKSFSVY
ncbi:MAG TPA: AN1-type zinc finger protein [Methanocella sp.]|nr:AN1-type zinc finger protein [Methanocella sp.]